MPGRGQAYQGQGRATGGKARGKRSGKQASNFENRQDRCSWGSVGGEEKNFLRTRKVFPQKAEGNARKDNFHPSRPMEAKP